VWAPPALLDAAVQRFDGKIEEMMKMIADKYGPHPWGAANIVVAPKEYPVMAKGFPCITFVSPEMLHPCIALDFTFSMANESGRLDAGVGTEALLHATVSLWFGQMVTAATWRDFWLSNALSRYASRRVMQELEGSSCTFMASHVSYTALQNATKCKYRKDSTQLVLSEETSLAQITTGVIGLREEVIAEKGFLLITEVQRQSGADLHRFDCVLAQFCHQYSKQSVTTNDLFTLLFENFPQLTSRFTKQIDFSTWLSGSGVPDMVATVPQSAAAEQASGWQQWLQPVEQLVELFCGRGDAGQLEQATQRAPGPVSSWTRRQVLAFLDMLLQEQTLPEGTVQRLNKAFRFSGSKDLELQIRWMRLVRQNEGPSVQWCKDLEALVFRTGLASAQLALLSLPHPASVRHRVMHSVHPSVKAALVPLRAFE